jgi:hypothetical protein
LAIKFKITIEESFGLIQNLLVAGLETYLGCPRFQQL